jgi:Leucine-rich repeat (LRR) protein
VGLAPTGKRRLFTAHVESGNWLQRYGPALSPAMGKLKLHLSLWRQGLGVVPDEVWLRTNLQTLVLADNDLTEVSERVGDLSELRMLDLGHNRLRELPISLGRLEGLSDFLYLHDNRLTHLPDSLSRLQHLRYLNISENAFEVFPEVVTTMRSLIELRVTDNRLTELPPSISRLTSLRELHLRNNQLATLPGSIRAMRELRQIDLRGNPVTSLPEGLITLPRLEKLDLRWVITLEPPQWFSDLEAKGCIIYL